ncbi:MAG: endonuclease/exonuclease/phosphatase family protein [Chromatiaceae bacterium]|jgi:endonuclease/exonuclease/phosphatase family metal-dependent hydrolase|nr:endonuclease/exonuclease/phosphatase family protein [Chromatiaceae bacterium]
MQQLHLLSYNIQAGIYTRQYSEYVTKSWKHVLPHRERLHNLSRIASMLHEFDFVGLQEVDAGSLRSGFVDQTEYLAYHARFPYWYKQVNRNLGNLARHSNGVLSRVRPHAITEYKLPGLPGRGAVMVELETTEESVFAVCILHLALGWRARRRQLEYIRELAFHYPYLVLMGDFNCDCDSSALQNLVADTDLRGLDCELKTFPSWRPRRNLDHILVSKSLQIIDARVLDYTLSDHLPLSMKVALPEGVQLAA